MAQIFLPAPGDAAADAGGGSARVGNRALRRAGTIQVQVRVLRKAAGS